MAFVQHHLKWLAFGVGPVLALLIFVGCEKSDPPANAVSNSELENSVSLPADSTDSTTPEIGKTEEAVFLSGMEIGAVPLPFEVDDVTGPNKGKYLCYRCLYGERPVVGIFVRDLDANTQTLIKKIDQEVATHQDKKLAAFVVMLTDDPQSTKPELEKIARENKIENVPLTVFEGAAGPAGYQITKEAAVNVMMWAGEVKANRAYPRGQLNAAGIQEVIADARLIVD